MTHDLSLSWTESTELLVQILSVRARAVNGAKTLNSDPHMAAHFISSGQVDFLYVLTVDLNPLVWYVILEYSAQINLTFISYVLYFCVTCFSVHLFSFSYKVAVQYRSSTMVPKFMYVSRHHINRLSLLPHWHDDMLLTSCLYTGTNVHLQLCFFCEKRSRPDIVLFCVLTCR